MGETTTTLQNQGKLTCCWDSLGYSDGKLDGM